MTRRLLVTTSTYPRWDGDTHPRFVHDLCARLVADHDIAVVVLAPTSHGAQRDEVVDGVRIKRFAYWRDRPGLLRDGPALPTLKAHPTTALQVPTYLAALGRALRTELRDGGPWDAVHAHWLTPQATMATLAGAGASRNGPRLVATSHGSDVLSLGPAAAPLLRWTLARVDAFTGVSRAVVDRAREIGLPAQTEVAVAPMGIDTDLFRPDDTARQRLREHLRIPGEAPLLLSVGRLVPSKGVDTLLDALPRVLAAHPDLRVAVLGHGTERRDLEAQALRLGVGDAVMFRGFTPHAELAHWYAAADGLVGASRTEGFGLVYAEALASGCPVVATNLPALRDILGPDDAAATIPVGNSEALASVLIDRLTHRRGWSHLATTRAIQVAARFGWKAVAESYADILLPDGAPRRG